MLPNETFLQVTNCKENIAFGNNIEVALIDGCQNVVKLLEVNENFFYQEFTDIKGVKQIAYEFGNIGTDYYDTLLYLRLKHTVSDAVWYSAGFLVTYDNQEETSFFQYTAGRYFEGISYDVVNVFQTIRLACFKKDIDPTTEVETLTQLSGNRYALRPIMTKVDTYQFYTCDAFTYLRLATLLNHPIVYVNGQRGNTTANNLTKGEREPDSNFFEVTFEANPTEEFQKPFYQIYSGLECIGKNPLGDYYLYDYNVATSGGTTYTLSFNKSFTIASDITAKLYKNGVLFATFDASKFSISGFDLNIDVSGSPITDPAEYSVVIEPNKVIGTNENWEGFEYGHWLFTVLADPPPAPVYYNSEYYNSTNYNTD